MLVDPVDAFTQWARWRRYWPSELGYGRTMIDKLLSGMRTTICPRCRGEAQVVIIVEGRPVKDDCPRCAGTGRVSGRSSPSQINPATIRGTGRDWEDPQSEAVDKVVCGMPYLRRMVVIQEYEANGRRSDKERRIGVGRRVFERELEAAHKDVLAIFELADERSA